MLPRSGFSGGRFMRRYSNLTSWGTGFDFRARAPAGWSMSGTNDGCVANILKEVLYP